MRVMRTCSSAAGTPDRDPFRSCSSCRRSNSPMTRRRQRALARNSETNSNFSTARSPNFFSSTVGCFTPCRRVYSRSTRFSRWVAREHVRAGAEKGALPGGESALKLRVAARSAHHQGQACAVQVCDVADKLAVRLVAARCDDEEQGCERAECRYQGECAIESELIGQDTHDCRPGGESQQVLKQGQHRRAGRA